MSKNGENSPKRFPWLKFAVIFGILVVLPPLIIWRLMEIPPSAASRTEVSHWMDFWGSYLGGLMGAIAALIAVFFSKKQADALREEAKENQRLSVMPALSLKHKTVSSTQVTSYLEKADTRIILYPTYKEVFYETTPEDYQFACSTRFKSTNKGVTFMQIENCGMGPALNIKLCYGEKEIPITSGLKDGQTFSSMFIYIYDVSNGLPKPETIDITFYDIFENQYRQSQKLVAIAGGVDYKAPSSPILVLDD